jgi:hypothetical protein
MNSWKEQLPSKSITLMQKFAYATPVSACDQGIYTENLGPSPKANLGPPPGTIKQHIAIKRKFDTLSKPEEVERLIYRA